MSNYYQNGYSASTPPPEEAVQGPGIPANLAAERAVLGSILIDPSCFAGVSGILKADDFYREKNRWIYQAMQALTERREPMDFTLLTTELEAQQKLEEIGGPAALTDLISEIPTAMHAEYYAKIVEEMATRRRMITMSTQIARQAYDLSTPMSTLINDAEQGVLRVSSRRTARNVRHIRDILADWLKTLEAASNGERVGVPTGFGMLDKTLGGLQRSDLIVMAGRPGMGKSSFAFSITKHAVEIGARALVFSVEMSESQLANRLVSMATGINGSELRMGQNVDDDRATQIMTVCNDLSQTALWIDDTPAISVVELRSKARKVYAENGLDLIVVDYMQIMTLGEDGKFYNREQEVSMITRSLKALARELDVPIIALAQLSRSVESRADKRPMLSDLRGSGSIEQEADVVLLLYREDYYVEDTDRQNIADVLIAKHRNGATGTVSLYFRKELTEFRDLEISRLDMDGDVLTY